MRKGRYDIFLAKLQNVKRQIFKPSELKIDKIYILAIDRGFFDVIDDLTKCSKEGEFCLGFGTNVKPCCDGLECKGFPIKKCEVPQGSILKN